MQKSISEIILYFFMYSVLGWVWETIYCSIKEGKFVYRGFLMGPYCPIYGFSMLMILYLLKPYIGDSVISVYFISATLVTALEYVTAGLLEKLFHLTLWDYSKTPFNIKGRVALPISLFWGFGCLLLIYYVHPVTEKAVNFLYRNTGAIFPCIIVLAMLADTILSVSHVLTFKKFVEELKEKREQSIKEWKENISLKIEKRKLRFNERRIMNGFSRLNLKNRLKGDTMENEKLKEILERLKSKLKK